MMKSFLIIITMLALITTSLFAMKESEDKEEGAGRISLSKTTIKEILNLPLNGAIALNGVMYIKARSVFSQDLFNGMDERTDVYYDPKNKSLELFFQACRPKYERLTYSKDFIYFYLTALKATHN